MQITKRYGTRGFGMMTKEIRIQTKTMRIILQNTVTSNKEAFTDDELSTLTKDIETIRKN